MNRFGGSLLVLLSVICVVGSKRTSRIPQRVLFEEILRQMGTGTNQLPNKIRKTEAPAYPGFYSFQDEASYDAPVCPASELLAEHKRLSCRPRKTLVPLPPGPPEVVRFPKLVELERCHGSCYQESHLCHPVATQQIIVQVITVNLTEGRPVAQCTEVVMEKHSKCSCGCRIKKSHCSESQVYAASECTCKCKNLEEARRCTGSNKVWNPSRCSCDCLRDETSCSTGFYFSKDDCRCQLAVEYNVEGS